MIKLIDYSFNSFLALRKKIQNMINVMSYYDFTLNRDFYTISFITSLFTLYKHKTKLVLLSFPKSTQTYNSQKMREI